MRLGKTAALEGASLAFARGMFARYYASATVDPPPLLARRELAYMPFEGSGMRRHLGVADPDALRAALAREVPRHAYYSSAYYKDPSHPIMVSKGWAGADVIFDLDADHLLGAEGLSYARQLDLVKAKFRILLDEFLLRDFGVDETDLTLVFSGGRGYHAHLRRQDLLTLGSAERREMVQYLSPEGVDFSRFLPVRERSSAPEAPGGTPSSASSGGPKEHARLSKVDAAARYPRLPEPEAPGWYGRLTRVLFELFDAWEKAGLSSKQVAQELLRLAQEYHVESLTPEVARSVARQLVDDGKMAKAREFRVLELGGGRGLRSPDSLILLVRELAGVKLGETDAPVTTDIHRLIRLPGSLHGGTGLRVLRITRGQLDAFEPLRDALLPTDPGSRPVRVRLQTAVDHPVGGSVLRGSEGETLELPEPQALFLVLRGEAQLAPAS